MLINKLPEDSIVESNAARIQLLKAVAEFYTASIGVDWTEVVSAMPKLAEDPIGTKYLAFLILFELWLTFDRLDLTEEEEEFCYRAKLLVNYEDFHKLPLGTLKYIYRDRCEGLYGE